LEKVGENKSEKFLKSGKKPARSARKVVKYKIISI
jgi:hypothetical protein